jgi:hypothetical protein
VLGAVLQSTIDGRDRLHTTYEAAFASGLNELLLISVGLALIGLAAALVLVRTRDLWRPGV